MPDTFADLGYKDGSNNFIPIKTRAANVIAVGGVTAEAHITDSTLHHTDAQISGLAATAAGTAITAQKGANNGLAPLGVDGKIPSQYVSLSTVADASHIVADYAALLALDTTAAPLKTTVFVTDASGDSTVGAGFALYMRVAEASTAADWVKLTEQESLEVDVSEISLLDAAFCTSEEDMQSKNLRAGAIVLMQVTNE